MFCFSPPLPLAARPRPCAVCYTRVPRMMAEFNKGEDYIRQLSKQSTENARRRAENLDAPNPYPAPPPSQNRSPARGASNAGEEYVLQLARNSAENARRRREAVAEARQRAQEGAPKEFNPVNPVKPPVPSVDITDPVKNAAREKALVELDKLNKEAEELERIIKRREQDVREARALEKAQKMKDDFQPDPEVENFSPEKLHADIAAIEARLAVAEGTVPESLDRQIDVMEERLAETERASREVDMREYEKMRESLQRSVTREDEPVAEFVEEEPLMEEEEEEVDVSAEEELQRMRRGMVEIRLEAERYAKAMRDVQQKHEQMMRIIVENYMPGL